ncbi:MAG: hypothetical protein O2963_00210 [Proteobacteria bacterium]|nr:hypothetical protein [Pseudomonadota bacterium]
MGRKSNALSISESVQNGEITAENILNVVARARKFKAKVAKYPEELKIFAITLRAEGHTFLKVSKILGVSEGTVHAWCNDTKLDDLLLHQLSEQVKSALSKRLIVTAGTVLSRISDIDVEKASLLQKATTVAVLIDKARLLDGETTENVGMIYRGKTKAKSECNVIDAEFKELSDEISSLEGMREG